MWEVQGWITSPIFRRTAVLISTWEGREKSKEKLAGLLHNIIHLLVCLCISISSQRRCLFDLPAGSKMQWLPARVHQEVKNWERCGETQTKTKAEKFKMRELDSYISELQYVHVCSIYCLKYFMQQCTKAQLLPRTFLMQDTKRHSWSYSRISYAGGMKLFILEFSQTS